MPGNLLPHESLDELTAAARRHRGRGASAVHTDGALDLEAAAETGDLRGAPIDATVLGLWSVAGWCRGETMLELGPGSSSRTSASWRCRPSRPQTRPARARRVELMQRHPQLGLEFLRDERPRPGRPTVVRFHHERWDGGGLSPRPGRPRDLELRPDRRASRTPSSPPLHERALRVAARWRGTRAVERPRRVGQPPMSTPAARRACLAWPGLSPQVERGADDRLGVDLVVARRRRRGRPTGRSA